ncbi:NO-inducible flavohemoprotein [Paracoccus zhejiangensis]|uniref:nitric oxide dioxygenase n=1 Tax=Paracoccus zhejiangensis TaxID=1077935 RepID=A0A2H5F120_9RHOB|nr:NO-inducible flavohemoprotein [Paracoccus zhejiangensis]AUH65241.1 NO-inducible flavohemoprotein [Paracoccus zhejiangensis]
MPEPLSPEVLDLIEATAPAVAGHIDDIVAGLYRRLLADPEIQSLFNMTHQGGSSPQHKALATALVAYATHIRNPAVLGGGIERIAQKHAGLQILPEHYPHVGVALIGAVAEVLGDSVTPEIVSAWTKAYWFLADLLIAREEQIYAGAASLDGGWRGWRAFEIAAKEDETGEIASFTLRPADGGPVMAHRPGQYLSFRFDLGEGEEARRNYSISSAPNGRDYRITVKREPGGKVSGWLHEQAAIGTKVLVSPPAGDFFLDPRGKRQVVLLSGGVGLTPMISMLEARERGDAPMIYVHAARDGSQHAMRARHESLADESYVFYESPAANDVQGRDFTRPGRVDTAWLAQKTRTDLADYYICGPTGFMAEMVAGLRAANVPDDRIHYEFFGPAETQLT